MMARAGKYIGKIAISLIAFAFVVAIAAQIGLWAGIGWLNGKDGNAWALRRINGALAQTGYTVDATALHLFALQGFGADRIVVSDKTGVLADLHDVRFYIDLLPLVATRTVSISLTAGEANVQRMPAAAGRTQRQNGTGVLMRPFTLPDLYARGLDVRHFAIRRLTLDQGADGQTMTLSPRLSGTVSVRGNHIRFDISGGSAAEGQPAFIPETIHFKGTLDGDHASLALDEASVRASGYDIAGKGTAGLGQGGTLALEFHAGSDNLKILSAGKVAGRARADLLLGGTGNDPSLAIKGVAHFDDLAARGLDDIHATGRADHLTGHMEGTLGVSSSYGARPVSLAAVFDYAGSLLKLSSIKFTAPDIDAGGQGAFDTQTSLADGKIAATFKLDAYRDLIGAAVAGQGTIDLLLAARDGRQAVTLDADIRDMKYQSIAIRGASLSAALADTGSPWPDTAKLVLSGASFGDIDLTRLQAGVTKKDAGRYAMAMTGNGRYRQPFTLNAAADLKGTDAASAAADNIVLKIGAGRGALNVRGNVAPDRLALTLDAAELPLAAVPVALPDALAGLTVSGTGALNGMMDAPRAELDMKFSPLTVDKNAPAVTFALKGAYAGGKASGTLQGTGRGIDVLRGQGAAPVRLSLKPFALSMPGSTPLDAAFTARLDASALAAMLPPGEILKGRIEAQVKAGGTLDKPDVAGAATLAGGDFTDEGANIALHAIDMRATLKRDALTIESMRASDGRSGRVTGSGVIGLDKAGAVRATLTAADLNPFLSTGQVKGAFSADLALAGKSGAYRLTGTITPGAIDITIPERFGGNVPQLNIVDRRKDGRKDGRRDSAPMKTVTLDMKIHAPNRVFVRGWGLDAEFGGDLAVAGSLAAPLVNGTLESKRGRYEEFNRRFDLAHASLRFQGTVPPSPYLDIEAQTKADDITAVIDLTGPAADPKIALSSVPALPQDEVLSHILFGKDMTKISPFQAIQLAGTLQRFTGHGSGRPGLLETLRSKTGLDDLSVGNDDAGGTTVGAGKYITDKVYVQVGGGSAKNSGAATVKYQLTPHITVDSKVSQDAQAGGGVSWSWDY